MNVLTIRDARKSFGATAALRGVSLELGAGEMLALLGPNGAGKTTLVRSIAGRVSLDSGSIELLGRRLGAGGGREPLGVVPQEIALYPLLTARENLEAFGRLHGMPRAALKSRVEWALEWTALADRAREPIKRFSGGMKRRLNIACGVLHEPRVVLLDEPTVGVDPQSRHAILERVQEFGRQGLAVVYTTHYMEEAERVCTRVGIIDHGRLVAEGTRRELVSRLGAQDRIDLSATGDPQKLAEVSRTVPGVSSAAVADHTVHLIAADGRHLLPALLEAAEAAQVSVSSVDVVEPDLEAVFLDLTGTALRE